MELHYLAKVWLFSIYRERLEEVLFDKEHVASSVGLKHLLIGAHPSFPRWAGI